VRTTTVHFSECLSASLNAFFNAHYYAIYRRNAKEVQRGRSAPIGERGIGAPAWRKGDPSARTRTSTAILLLHLHAPTCTNPSLRPPAPTCTYLAHPCTLTAPSPHHRHSSAHSRAHSRTALCACPRCRGGARVARVARDCYSCTRGGRTGGSARGCEGEYGLANPNQFSNGPVYIAVRTQGRTQVHSFGLPFRNPIFYFLFIFF
jgi:hypothetical protein